MNTEEDNFPILRDEMEAAVKSLKKVKSAGVNNITAKLIQAGGEAVTNILTAIYNKIWQTGDWPTPWTQSMVITLPKKGNLQLCQNRAISLISHPSKVILKVILNTLKPQTSSLKNRPAFEQDTVLQSKFSTLESFACKKYLQHQEDLYHVFIDFKKAYDRVWHAALWATMRKYNIDIVQAIEHLYDKATSAVLMNGTMGEWFHNTIGVRQGCLLSPTLFNIFLERIMTCT